MKSGTSVYLDTSALVKLIRSEAETKALVRHLRRVPLVTSSLARTELLRAAFRSGDPREVARAEELLERIGLMLPTIAVFDQAGRASPPDLRSLDALHVVTAATLDSDLSELITYDERMSKGAQALGLPVAAPS